MMMRKTLRYVTVFHAIWISDLRLDRTQSSAKRGNSNYAAIITGRCGAGARNVLLLITEVTATARALIRQMRER